MNVLVQALVSSSVKEANNFFLLHSCSLSQVESFILDQEDLDNPIMKTASELLLSSATDGVDLRTVDPETQARLEALLEAAGMAALSEFNSALQDLVHVHF